MACLKVKEMVAIILILQAVSGSPATGTTHAPADSVSEAEKNEVRAGCEGAKALSDFTTLTEIGTSQDTVGEQRATCNILDIIKKVTNIVAIQLSLNPATLGLGLNLTQLGATPADILAILQKLQQTFGITIDLDCVGVNWNILSLITFVLQKLGCSTL